jgi:ribose transport system substrate-binding protein
MMKRITTLTLIALMLVMAVGTGPAMGAKKIRIGFSQYTQKAPFYVAQVEAAKAEAKKNPNIELIVVDAQDSVEKQISDVEDLIARKCDIIVLNPKDPQALIPVTRAVNRAGIPLIIADSTIDPSVNYVTCIKSDNFAIGKLVGEHLSSQLKGKGNVVIISGSVGNIGGEERRTGMISGFMENSLRNFNQVDINIVAQGWGGWTHEGGLKAMEDILVAHKNIDAVYAENDSMALGAMKAIREAGRDILVCGIDGQKEAFAMIKSGDYLATGLNSPTILGEMTIRVALQVLKGEKVPQTIYTPADCINASNINKYYNPKSIF